MVSTAIFDIDGTLLDSVELHARAWQDAFADFKITVPLEDVRKQIGKGGDQLLPVYLTDAQRDEFGDALEEHRGKLFKARYLPSVRPFPKVPELVRRLRDGGTQVALASSGKEDEVKEYIRIAGIEGMLDATTSSSDAEKSKPHPDIFAAALKRLNKPDPAQVIAVGDTPFDAEAAGKLGIRTVGLLCGGWGEGELRQAGCVAVFRDPADLLERFGTSPLA